MLKTALNNVNFAKTTRLNLILGFHNITSKMRIHYVRTLDKFGSTVSTFVSTLNDRNIYAEREREGEETCFLVCPIRKSYRDLMLAL